MESKKIYQNILILNEICVAYDFVEICFDEIIQEIKKIVKEKP